MDRVLCHGDLWSMNILWRSNGNGRDELKLAAVLDYRVIVANAYCLLRPSKRAASLNLYFLLLFPLVKKYKL